MTKAIKNKDFLQNNALQKLFKALNAHGQEARLVGGAVRNALLGLPITDIDIATTNRPLDTMARVKECGFDAIPTGIEHGTITVVAPQGEIFEVTTLRQDVENFGRKAKVVFGKDWEKDARRRDFTINALYLNAFGVVYDYVGGLQDIENKVLRFIGDPEQRINEDYLRILRFFRFFAYYGEGRPDAAALKACAKLKEGLDYVSAERIWSELKKIFSAPNPWRSVLWMRQTGVLNFILPQSDKWGIDGLGALITAQQVFNFPADPLLRLQCVIPPHKIRILEVVKLLKLSNREKKRLLDWGNFPQICEQCNALDFKKLIYVEGSGAALDYLTHKLAAAYLKYPKGSAEYQIIENYENLLQLARNWQAPQFPIQADDLIQLGYQQGKDLGAMLQKLQKEWTASGFSKSKQQLLQPLRMAQ